MPDDATILDALRRHWPAVAKPVLLGVGTCHKHWYGPSVFKEVDLGVEAEKKEGWKIDVDLACANKSSVSIDVFVVTLPTVSRVI